MVRTEQDYIKLLIEGEKSYSRRQDVPIAYDMTTVAYVAQSDSIKNNNKLFDGRVKADLIPKERSVDIDDEIDFKILRLIFLMNLSN